MTRAKRAQAWRARLERANLRLVKRLRAAMRREYQVCAAEVIARAFEDSKHRARVTHLLRKSYRATFDRFGALAFEMLGDIVEQPITGQYRAEQSMERAAFRRSAPAVEADFLAWRADQKPEQPTPPPRAQIVAVLTAILATAVAEHVLGEVLDILLADERVVAAVSEALATEATFAGAVAAASRNPVVVSSVASAIIAGAIPPEGASPGAPPPPPPPPPSGGRPTERLTFRERVARFIEQHAEQRGQRISMGTRDVITAAEARAVRDGVMGEAAVANRVAEELTGVRKSGWRARRIARTEVGAAQNAALLAMAEDRGVPFTKEWVSIDDHRTRPTHADADGQKIQAHELFSVGGAALAHPGDPNAPLKEIVNCRCTMLLERVE